MSAAHHAYSIATVATISLGGGKDSKGNKLISVKVDVDTTLGYKTNCTMIADAANAARRAENEGDDDGITVSHALHNQARSENMPHAKDLLRSAVNEPDLMKRAAMLKLALKGYARRLR